MNISDECEDINEIIFQAIGEASMCWDPIPIGVFDSSKAKEIGDKLISKIKRHYCETNT